MWPPLALLTGHLASTSLAKYAQAVAAYRAWCGSDAVALAATSLARWRTHLVQHTTAFFAYPPEKVYFSSDSQG